MNAWQFKSTVHRILGCIMLIAGAGGCDDLTGSRDERILWFYPDPKGAAAEPYADSGLVVFTSFNDMRVIALDPRNGKLKWQRRLPLPAGVPYAGMPSGGNVAAHEDLVIVPAWDVYGLRRTDGQVQWIFQPTDDYPGYSSVFVANGVVYSVGRYLYALDARTGMLLYRRDLGEQPFRPVVVGSIIYVATRREIAPGVLGNGRVLALDLNGIIRWSVPIVDPEDSARGGSVGPVFLRDSLAVVAGMNGVVYALDRQSGNVRWTYTSSGSFAAGLAIVGETVIVAGDEGSVIGIDLDDGRRLWSTGPGSSVLERITLGDGVALVSVGALFAFDSNGQIQWQHGGAAWGGPVYSTAATYRDSKIYIGSVSPESRGPGFYAIRVP